MTPRAGSMLPAALLSLRKVLPKPWEKHTRSSAPHKPFGMGKSVHGYWGRRDLGAAPAHGDGSGPCVAVPLETEDTSSMS